MRADELENGLAEPQDAASSAMGPTAASWLTAQPLRAPARSDEHLVALRLHGRSRHTQRAYMADVVRFRVFVDRPLAEVSVGDLKGFADALCHLSPASQARALAAVKSLLAFGHP